MRIFAPFAPVVGFLAADAAAKENVPLAYYVATIVTIGAIFTVIKVWESVKKTITAPVTVEIANLARKIDLLPCQREGFCHYLHRAAESTDEEN